ncbi:FliH/SctL family protein [Nocardioides massiliensis]|uniref:Flagellar assembly protein FliH n=1 Tax=Nocardioides massiliensis TaxID=1325935 RepID=A0ABT9NMR7_9ACTN|nr:FliH/SctL family protein [Nocardioides massiliensis]MDP9821711.1 flagellar assembly protein FliH [Nocardioides massiliensis]
MTSSWTEDLPDLRAGTWTRLGDPGVLGDAVTEQLLTGLAAEARAAARSQGYAVGWAEGRRHAEAEAADLAEQVAAERAALDARRDAEHRAALAALETAAARLHDTVAAVCDQVADRAVEVALQLTEALLGREVGAADAVRRTLELLPAEPVVRVRMASADAAATDAADLPATVRVVPDATLTTGEVVLETDEQVIDGRFSTALLRVREALA